MTIAADNSRGAFPATSDVPLWHQLAAGEVARRLETDPASGLPSSRVDALLKSHGPNELAEQRGRGPWRMLWEQFTATIVLLLIAAGVISSFLGKWNEALAIFAIVILFGLLGFFQEYRAERAMAALKKLAVPSVRARRDGQTRTLSARDLVPGDIVLLEAGNLVPADLRLVESVNLRIQEAALTGESEAVEKHTEALASADVSLGDRCNMAYLGTVVTYGRGSGLVVATGMRTELGRVASLLQDVASELTPLQKRLDRIGKMLAAAGVLIAVALAILGMARGEALADMFLVAVSVAVAIVPEGLPAVVTITLALGARRMLARNALIRKLPAVETLGSVTVICSDKTGTLTQNQMTVTVLDVANHERTLDATTCHALTGRLREGGDHALGLLLAAGALVNDAELQGEEGAFHTTGDPTEAALVLAAAHCGLRKDILAREAPRIMELPFDSERKRMTTVHEVRGGIPGLPAGVSFVGFTKGSVDGLLHQATRVWEGGTAVPLGDAMRHRIEEANAKWAREGMRVLAVALRLHAERPARADEHLERELVFIGLVGMIDPPRPEVKQAVAVCRAAGIRPIMITGDHPLTALAIARDLGIAGPQDRAITGAELGHMDDAALTAAVENVSVFARVSPEHKLRIVGVLQARGHVVAMTGDGVNDAPALKKADIGVAMGITGTDVAKETGAMVLRDDNFATIVSAVEEGRVIYDNIRKFVKFSIGGNIGKVMVMMFMPLLAALVPGGEALLVPLLPLQLLWLNLLTDGLLGISLGVEPAEPNVMTRKPVASDEGVFSHGGTGQVLRMGLVIGSIAMGVGLAAWQQGEEAWQTMMFTSLAFSQIFQAFSIRTGHHAIYAAGWTGNRTLLALGLAVALLQAAALYWPFLRQFLGTMALSGPQLLVCAATSALVMGYAELEKATLRWWQQRGGMPASGSGL